VFLFVVYVVLWLWFTLHFYLKIHRRMSLKTTDVARANILTLSTEEPTAIVNNTAETIVQLPGTSRDDEDVESDGTLEGDNTEDEIDNPGSPGGQQIGGAVDDRMLASHNVFLATGDWVAVKIVPQPNAKKIHVPVMYIAHITKIEREDNKYTVSFVTLKAPGQPGVYVCCQQRRNGLAVQEVSW